MVLGSFVTWFVLLPPDATAGSAGGAGTVSDGAAAASGPGPSRSARIFVSRATGACLDHGETGLRSVDCSASATQKWRFTTWPDDSVELRSAATAVCLDDSVALGLRALPCTRTSRQKWG
ncbi:RICIN domain-containing protein [Streptomyces microflavus]|uniref:RICIN domain-containing protein n=1 Tax=Streptomyces microflavus TaxID=1919 RepID=UPI0033F5C824